MKNAARLIGWNFLVHQERRLHARLNLSGAAEQMSAEWWKNDFGCTRRQKCHCHIWIWIFTSCRTEIPVVCGTFKHNKRRFWQFWHTIRWWASIRKGVPGKHGWKVRYGRHQPDNLLKSNSYFTWECSSSNTNKCHEQQNNVAVDRIEIRLNQWETGYQGDICLSQLNQLSKLMKLW